MLLHTRIGHRGHKLNLLGDCLNIRTTQPVYYQVAIRQMATKIQAEMNLFSTKAYQGQKLSNCHISLYKSFFFRFNQKKFHSCQSCPMLRGVIKKIREPSRLLGTWYLAVFQK
jgi:hypothetical protein